jgi:hypothetical protein
MATGVVLVDRFAPPNTLIPECLKWGSSMRTSISFRTVLFTGGLLFCACSSDKSGPANGSGGSSGSGEVTASGGTSSPGETSSSGGKIASSGATSTPAVVAGNTGGGGGASEGGRSAASTPAPGGTISKGGTTGTGGTTNKGGTTGKAGSTATGGTNGAGGSIVGGGTASGGAAGGGSTSPAGATPENAGAACKVTAGELKKNQKLPDPFAMHDGTRIATKAAWECRRNEIKMDIEKYEIGPKPEPPTVKASLSGTTLNVDVTTSSGSITLSSTTSGTGSCVVIGMNSNSSLVTGCVQVPFKHDQVVGYNSGGGTQSQSDPFYKVYPSLWGKIGNYAAWSWGISRLIDGLEQVKDQLKIDTTKIAVHGCSYAGKMALFGGALDERVALTVVQESGGGGINAWRTSQDFTTRTSTNIEKIDNTNYAWFMSSMKKLDPYSLPHDHHELIAMIAPRATIILGNPDMEWLGDESGYRSTMAAVEVWKAMGVPDRIGYDFAAGHSHCQAASSQTSAVKTFVDRFLKDGTGATNIALKPATSKFDLDYSKVIDWTTPTLP